jgi:hypothetical protein
VAHWLPGDELGVRTEVAPLSRRQLTRLPEWTRRVHDRLLGTRRPAHPRPHRPDPRPRPVPRPDPHHRPPRPPPAPPPRHHPRPRPPTMTLPRSPDAARTSSAAGPPPSSPTHRPSAHTLAGAPAGHLAPRPPSVTRVMHPWSMPNWCSRFVRRARLPRCDARWRLTVQQGVVECSVLRFSPPSWIRRGRRRVGPGIRAVELKRLLARPPHAASTCFVSHVTSRPV